MASQKYPTVSEVVHKIKGTLESEYSHLSVEGEVSNLTRSSTGHWYFTLSDKSSSLSAALFRMDAARNPLIKKIKEGDKVVCSGNLSVYSKRGTFQILVRRIVSSGKGDLKEELERLKKKLAGEGLFDPEHKKNIPKFPKRIAVITAKSSAAFQDFSQILKRRTFSMDLLLCSALVQGEKAPDSIRKALFNVIKYSLENSEDKRPDVIVLTRGGGSLEDLWAFNDEALVWDIFNCPIPVISAVGHEVDYSLTDLVSDLRCETPSAAAEVLSEYQVQILERLVKEKGRLYQVLLNAKQRLNSKIERTHPKTIMGKLWNLLHNQQRRLYKLEFTSKAAEYTGINEFFMRLDDSVKEMKDSMNGKGQKALHRCDKSYEVLRVLDPHNVLERGYTYIQTPQGKVVSSQKSFDLLKSGEALKLNFYDGQGEVQKR